MAVHRNQPLGSECMNDFWSRPVSPETEFGFTFSGFILAEAGRVFHYTSSSVEWQNGLL